MDISFQVPPRCDHVTKQNVHSDLLHGDTTSLVEWMQRGRNIQHFKKRILSYPYKVQHQLLTDIIIDDTRVFESRRIRHPGFYHLGIRYPHEWVLLEIIERIKYSIFVDDEDEIWAFHIIALTPTHTFHRDTLWKYLMNAFDGSSRWVRCFTSFLCSQSDFIEKWFCRLHMVNGWYYCMNHRRTFELLRCIYPTFQHASMYPPDSENTAILNGEPFMMGVVLACENDDPFVCSNMYYENSTVIDIMHRLFTGEQSVRC